MFEKELKEIDALKKQWQKLMPRKGIYHDKLNLFYEVEFVYDSNKIEGSSLDLRDTALLIEKGITSKGKPIDDHLAAINHKKALDLVKTLVKKNKTLNEKSLLAIHEKVLAHKILSAGSYRNSMIMIIGSKFEAPPANKITRLIKEYFGYYNRNKKKKHPVLMASDLHQQLVNIHPFSDGNGRASRLIMNYHLLQNGYCITNVKSKNSKQYYEALREYDQKSNPAPFRKYIIKCVKESFRNQLKILTKG